MNSCTPHNEHNHVHGPLCGHTAVEHEGHTDFLANGRLLHPHDDHYDLHIIAVTENNPDQCTPSHECGCHDAEHVHGPGCGHDPVPHGDHVDYLVDGHLHYPHGDHCDDHGPLTIVDKLDQE